MLEIGRHHMLVVRERHADRLVLGALRKPVVLPAAAAPADAVPGEFACLEAVAVSAHGAFFDWGLATDLVVPFREQPCRMAVGERHMVPVCVGERSQRDGGIALTGAAPGTQEHA